MIFRGSKNWRGFYLLKGQNGKNVIMEAVILIFRGFEVPFSLLSNMQSQCCRIYCQMTNHLFTINLIVSLAPEGKEIVKKYPPSIYAPVGIEIDSLPPKSP